MPRPTEAAGPSIPVLTRRTLNRTLLARQALLERVHLPAETMIERLVGLQAQEPGDPYVALWSRIDAFDPGEVSTMIEERRAVRIGVMRTTLHLVTAHDCRILAPLTADIHARTFRSTSFARSLEGLDVIEVAAVARSVLEERPLTPTELGAVLAETWPGRDPTALAMAARYHLPLVQVPPRGLWGRTGRATNTTADAWLGTPPPAAAAPDEVLLRYLAAFGPASVSDARTWSGLNGLREVVDRLRPRLRRFRDEAGRELLDIEDGKIVDGDVPVPIRFLPQYDNVFLSHEERSRIHGDGVTGIDFGWKGPIIIDGFIGGAWRVRRAAGVATMTVELGADVGSARRSEIEAEADRLATFLDPTATRALRQESPVT